MALRKAVRRWLLLGIGVPVIAAVAERLGQRVEASRGPNAWSKGLRGGAAGLRKVRSRGRRGRQ